jgi:hypothetical protein
MATLWDSFSHGLIAHQSEPCRTFDCKHAVTSKGATERQANGLQVGHGRRELLSSTELITTLPEYASTIDLEQVAPPVHARPPSVRRARRSHHL